MNWLRKMVSGFVQPVLIRDPATWPRWSGAEVKDTNGLMSISAGYACVNLLTGLMSTMPCQLFQTRNGERSQVTDHDLYRLLHDSPNSDQTALEFWEQITGSLEVKGNAYAEKIFVGPRVVSLYPIHPDLMEVKRNEQGSIVYNWTEARGTRRTGTSQTVLHFRGFGGDALGGLSPLKLASKVFSTARSADDAAKAAFDNGMRPSGLLKSKDWVPDEKRKEYEELLQNKFMGAMNTGRPMLIENGMEWEQLSFNPEESQMLESRGFSVEEVCRIFGVPPFMVGHTEKVTSWGSGLAEQIEGFKKFSLTRRVERLEQRLMKDLLTPEDRAKGIVIEFNFDSLLRADIYKRYQVYEIATRNGLATVNECRRRENQPPVDGGDIARVQSQSVPLNKLLGMEL